MANEINTSVVKNWWKGTTMDDTVLESLVSGKIEILGYKLSITSGHRAFLIATKDKVNIIIFDCNAPDTKEELKQTLLDKLNSDDAVIEEPEEPEWLKKLRNNYNNPKGGKRRNRKSKKSKKSKKTRKSGKNRRKSKRTSRR